MRRENPLILGGGPAGASAGIALVGAGIAATLLERSREAEDALCGGFLSWRTLESLATLGIEAAALNPRPVTRVRLTTATRAAEVRLPAPALGVSRRRLDALLLARAQAAGVAVERGVTVREVASGTVRLADATVLTADRILLATGKHDVRGSQRSHDVTDPTLGLRLRLPASPHVTRLVGDAVELHLFDRGYAGLVLQEDGSANLCLAVRRSRLRESGDPATLIAALAQESPRLGERLAHVDALPAADAVANVPYGWRATTTEAGVYRIGDQAAVIPSLAGEGMGIAIASGIRAARALAAGTPAPTFQADLARATRRPVAVASAIWHAAEHPATAAPLVALSYAPVVRAAARLTRINM
ncbi:FAD-dependent monooxygenase [Sphingomonas donggukensis]|uniref:FAD-dependent monooxygenase n=1 Tax=Sphingomonas donggukensis TaxID=2949093 RepID=A0ABY4TS70_9SPHN|nr:FAD-dependent monooxygenase [Sphingomonas donggukensis]URW75257.1 FAD-dependent monooxygenase [Sphingomonas donggukensis]